MYIHTRVCTPIYTYKGINTYIHQTLSNPYMSRGVLPYVYKFTYAGICMRIRVRVCIA